MRIFTFLLLLIASSQLSAQNMRHTEVIKEDNRDINFEIIGKVGTNYVIYKNVRWKNMIAVYDQNMKLISNSRLTFMPEKTFNLDFIAYPDHFYIVYQYQKKNVIYCKAVKMGPDGKKLSEPILLDTTRVGLLLDRRIYSTVFSEDKSHILVYKMQRRNNQLFLTTRLYNNQFSTLDSTFQRLNYDDRRDIYSDLQVDNNGNYLFAHERRRAIRDGVTALKTVIWKPGADTSTTVDIPLSGKVVDEVVVKVDNLNGSYLFNSLYYYDGNDVNIYGIFSALYKTEEKNVSTAFIPFSDSLRTLLSQKGIYKSVFDNMFIREVIAKRDGGFIIATEDYYSYRSGSTMDSWRRLDYLYGSPYSANDYYLYNRSYRNYYRPYNMHPYTNTRYHYNDIAIISVGNDLVPEWSSVIHKKQSADESDNFLSYARMNSGNELYFLFVENDKKSQVITNHSLLPNGQVKRNGTLRSNETGLEFMPKMGKQVSARQMIIPAMYRGFVTFALVDFTG